MPAPHVVAGILSEITPLPVPPFERAFETSPEGFRCAFGDGTIAWLRPGAGQAARLRILESRRQRKAPVYVELDDDLAIVTLRLPRIGKASRPREHENGDLAFELFPSQCIHTLVRSNRDFTALRSALEQSRARDQWLLVTGTDSHDIIHAASVPPSELVTEYLQTRPGFFTPAVVGLIRARQWLRDWMGRSIRARAAVTWPTEAQAQHLFNTVVTKSCAASSPAPDCIPFEYPDDGCKARAHKMCRLIEDQGFTPRKIFIDLPGIEVFTVATKNKPGCKVVWSHHVAPLLEVVTNAGVVEDYVIDPSLFPGPVLRTDWVAWIKGASPPLITVWPWYFYNDSGQLDDNLSKTDAELATVRAEFEMRRLEIGPPPYC
jgi:hypothetical protein